MERKELPKSFACTNTDDVLWKKYIAWFNQKGERNCDGNLRCGYYGLTNGGEWDYHSYQPTVKKYFDNIISLEEWDEIVNGNKETKIMKKELPKSFACKNTNAVLWTKYIAWLNKTYCLYFDGNSITQYYGITKTGNCDNSGRNCFDTILTLEEWDEIVNGNKETKIMNKTVKKSDLKKIHDVACLAWQSKIKNLTARNVFGDTVELTHAEIDEMFKAAEPSQIKVLEEVFGKQLEDLDFRSDTIHFEVDGLPVFGTSDMNQKDAFIGLPRYEGSKHKFFLNQDYEWELNGTELVVKRK